MFNKILQSRTLFTLTTHPKILPREFSFRFEQYIRHSKELDELNRMTPRSDLFYDFEQNYEQLNFRWNNAYVRLGDMSAFQG